VEDIDDRLRKAGDELATNRKAQDASYRLARKLACIASEAGRSNRRIAELLGVDRMTVRKWVGKR
jgi:transposase